MDVGSLAASLTLDTGLFMAGIAAATAAARNLGSSLSTAMGGNAQNAINNTTKSVNNLSSGFKDLGRIVSGIVISQAFYGMVEDIKKGTAAVFEFSAAMEQAKISLGYFVGPQNADGFLAQLQQFATKTPFYTEQVVDLSRRLMAAGMPQTQVIPTLSIMNDAASANPAPEVQGGVTAQMDRLVLAITEVMDRGKMMGKEMNQFANAGIPVFKILHDQLGLTAKQMSEVGKTAIPASTAIQAILQGLNARYSGAAEKMTKTLSGSLRVIKDDALLIGSQIIEGIFNPMRDSSVALSKFMNQLRDAGQLHGLGGIFEALVPKDIQNSVRVIIGSIESIGKSVSQLVEALKPAASLMLTTFGTALTIILPPIAAVVRGIAELVQWAENSIPAIKLFTAAVMTILVADVAANSLRFLWAVTRMGAVCTIIAEAVMTLVKAIQFLAMALVENPITGIIMLIAGALLYLAFSSGVATQYLDMLTAKLGQLAGFNVGNIFKPTNNDAMKKWLDGANQSLAGINDNLSNTGKNMEDAGNKAKKAGKQVKDTFVAAFDEVFQVPDKLDQVANALGGVGNAAGDIPNIGDLLGNMPNPPALPPITMPTLPSDNKQQPNYPPVNPPGAGAEGGGPPNIEPPNTGAATGALQALGNLVTEVKGKFVELEDVIAGGLVVIGQKISNWASTGWGEIKTWVTNTVSTIQGWAATTENIFSVWSTNIATIITNWATATESAFVTWASTTGTTIASWVNSLGTSISTWTSNTVVSFTGWVSTTAILFTSWAANTWNTINIWVANTRNVITSWALNAIAVMGNWIVNTQNSIASWAAATSNELSSWASQAISSISRALSATASSITSWVTATEVNIKTWATTVAADINTWATATIAVISSWISATAKGIISWANSTGKTFADWANGVMKIVSTWAQGTARGFSDWIQNVANGFVSWANSVLNTMGEWAKNAGDAVASFANGAWSSISQFLNGSANQFANWGNSVISTVWATAQAVIQAAIAMAEAMGDPAPSVQLPSQPNVSSSYHSQADKVAGQSWWIPAALAAMAVGAIAVTVLTDGAAAPVIAEVAPEVVETLSGVSGFATGGIIDQDQIARVGEGNRREAIIPLENSSYMKPFSAAVANDLFDMMTSGPQYSGGNTDTRPIVYVGNLIADDRSLKELERKLQLFRISEAQRKGQQI